MNIHYETLKKEQAQTDYDVLDIISKTISDFLSPRQLAFEDIRSKTTVFVGCESRSIHYRFLDCSSFFLNLFFVEGLFVSVNAINVGGVLSQ